MPYPGVPSRLTPKMEDCVEKVMKDGKTKDQAIAICKTTIMKKANETYKGTINSFVAITADEKGKAPKQIKVIPIGRWMSDPYGEMEITPVHCEQMAKNFAAGVRGDELPVDVDHDGGKAAGWFKDLIAKDDGLYADVEWNEYGKALLADKQYKLFSPEWSFDYRDPLTGTPYGPTLIAGSLTNRPLFKQLPKLMASELASNENKDLTNGNALVLLFNETMNVDEVLAKKSADRTPEEKAFLEGQKSSLTDAQKAKLDETAETPAPTPSDNSNPNPAPSAPASTPSDANGNPDANQQATTQDPQQSNTASEKTVTIKASELEEMKKASEEVKALRAQARKVAAEKEVDTLIASEKKLLPKHKDAVVNFVLTCSDDQKKAFMDIVKGLPTLEITQQAGDGGTNSHLTATEKINNLVIEARKANDKLTVAEATEKVLRENTKLANDYEEELKEKNK